MIKELRFTVLEEVGSDHRLLVPFSLLRQLHCCFMARRFAQQETTLAAARLFLESFSRMISALVGFGARASRRLFLTCSWSIGLSGLDQAHPIDVAQTP